MEKDIDCVSNKKGTILEKLNKRNKDRQNYLETKIEIRSKDYTETEGADYFAHEFSERVKEIEKNINNIQPGSIDLTRIFSGITNDIQELQKYLSNSTLFLPDYNIKACQNILNELTARTEDIRQKLMPKKRFGFHNKKAVSLKSTNKSGVDKIDYKEKANISTSSFTWTLSNREGEYIVLMGIDVDRKDITISNLKNCFVEIRGHAGSVQIANAVDCVFLCGPISRSLFAENCFRCKIVAACQQLRLHGSTNCKLWLHVTCRAIVEDCKQIEVGDYIYEYSGIEIDFKKSGLDAAVNNFRDIADFNWLSPEKPSPNWKLVNGDDFQWINLMEMRDEFIKNNIAS